MHSLLERGVRFFLFSRPRTVLITSVIASFYSRFRVKVPRVRHRPGIVEALPSGGRKTAIAPRSKTPTSVILILAVRPGGLQ